MLGIGSVICFLAHFANCDVDFSHQSRYIGSDGTIEQIIYRTHEGITEIANDFPLAWNEIGIPTNTGDNGVSVLTAGEAAHAYDAFFEANKIFAKQRWLGVHSEQNPIDAWIIQEVLADTRPDLIVETGTHNGGGTLFFASILSLLEHSRSAEDCPKPSNSDINVDSHVELGTNERVGKQLLGRVLTIDAEPLHTVKHDRWHRICNTDACRNVLTQPLWQQRVDHFNGDTASKETVERVFDYVEMYRRKVMQTCGRDAKVMVILDSLHSWEHVYAEMKHYWSLVSVGQYLLVQDTHLDQLWSTPARPFLGPERAVRLFFVSEETTNISRHFMVDRSREYMILSMHRGGYLLRAD